MWIWGRKTDRRTTKCYYEPPTIILETYSLSLVKGTNFQLKLNKPWNNISQFIKHNRLCRWVGFALHTMVDDITPFVLRKQSWYNIRILSLLLFNFRQI